MVRSKRSRTDTLQPRNKNFTSPSTRIPNDLLLLIFSEAKRTTFSNANLRKVTQWHNLVKEWVRLSHVCQVWRAILLGSSSMWSTILLNNKLHRWAAEMFRRCINPCPLSVFIYINGHKAKGSQVAALALVSTTLKANMARCRELVAARLPRETLRSLFKDTKAPLLQTLYVGSYDVARPNPSSDFVLEDALLKAPSLKNITALHCGLDVSFRLMSDLTHLKLHYPSSDSDHPPRITMRAFLELLSRSSGLQSVSFRYRERVGQGLNVVEDHPKVHLPYLQDLTLKLPVNMVACILQTVIFPTSCRVQLSGLEPWDEPTPYRHFHTCVSALSTHFQSSTPQASGGNQDRPARNAHTNVKTLRVSRQWGGIVMVGFHEALTHDDLKKNSVQAPIIFHYNMERGGHQSANFGTDIVQPLISLLDLSELETLELAGDLLPDVSLLSDLFGSLPKIHSVLLDKEQSNFFAQALVRGLSNRRSNHPGSRLQDPNTPFPTLKTIIVQDTRSQYKYWQTAYTKSLTLRKRHGCPIERLRLHSNFEEPHGQDISKVVSHLEVMEVNYCVEKSCLMDMVDRPDLVFYTPNPNRLLHL